MFDSARGGLTRIRWLPCQNTTANDIPGFAVMRVTGVADPSTTDNEYVLTVDQPNGTDALYCVNGPQVIKKKSGSTPGQGICSFDFPNLVLYDSGSGTPTAGDNWGPVSGSWKLGKTATGYKAAGGVTEGRALFESIGGNSQPNGWITFTTAAALLASDASQASCPVALVWEGADPGSTLTIYNELGFEADAGVDGYAKLCKADGKWKIVIIPCPAGTS